MRALVTGACGFVGAYLMRHLLDCGDEALGAVFRAATSGPQEYSFPHVGLDVADAEACARVITEYKPEVIFHLAGQAFVPAAESNFTEALLVNVGGVHNVYRVCHLLDRGVVIVLVSSGEVYGLVRAAELPLTEESEVKPANNYSLSKVMAELVSGRYDQFSRVRSVIMRPFNHIGPGQSDRFVISSFARQLALIARGRSAAVMSVGNLEARRDFSDVRDVVRAYRLAALKGEGVYNIGSGRSVMIGEVLNELIRIAELNVRIEHDPERLRPSDVAEVYTSYARAQNDLGWSPQYDLRTSLKETYEYWLERV